MKDAKEEAPQTEKQYFQLRTRLLDLPVPEVNSRLGLLGNMGAAWIRMARMALDNALVEQDKEKQLAGLADAYARIESGVKEMGESEHYRILRNMLKVAKAHVTGESPPTNEELGLLPVMKPKCFIATAACGGLSEEVVILQSFRDITLGKTRLGRRFVAYYQKFSPPVAKLISLSPFLQRIVRRLMIIPLVSAIRKNRSPST